MPFQSPWVRRVFLALFGLILGLLCAEGLLRLFEFPRFHRAHSSPPRFTFLRAGENGELAYVNKPSGTIRFEYDSNPRGYFKPGNGVEHTINSAGFRGPEFHFSKPKGTVRLAFLGDSFTFGEGVHDTDTFAEVTAKLLQERFADKGLRFESYNFGVGGYNTSQELFMLTWMALPTQPDAVVLCYALNDAEPPLFRVNEASQKPERRPREANIGEGLDDSTPPQSLIYRLRVAQLVWQAGIRRERGRQTEAYYRSLYRPEAEGWKNSRHALRDIVGVCKSRQIPLLIVVFPILYKLDGQHPFQDLHQTIAREIEAIGPPVLDLLPAFQGEDYQSLWVHPTDQHPNEKAHRIAAEQMTKTLADNPEFLRRLAKE